MNKVCCMVFVNHIVLEPGTKVRKLFLCSTQLKYVKMLAILHLLSMINTTLESWKASLHFSAFFLAVEISCPAE